MNLESLWPALEVSDGIKANSSGAVLLAALCKFLLFPNTLREKQAINWLLTTALNLHQLIALDYSWAEKDFLSSNSVSAAAETPGRVMLISSVII